MKHGPNAISELDIFALSIQQGMLGCWSSNVNLVCFKWVNGSWLVSALLDRESAEDEDWIEEGIENTSIILEEYINFYRFDGKFYAKIYVNISVSAKNQEIIHDSDFRVVYSRRN